jgi:NOL1/NOP2/sun family putative RNA methylase
MTLPELFVERTKKILGNDFSLFEKALNENAPTSVRVNNKMEYIPVGEKVKWCNQAYYLDERPLFTADPLFHAGVYYVQEASSMFLHQAIKQHFANAETVLDLCAAPGGKSTLLTQTLPENSLLISNEIVRSRAYILAENLIKWGNHNVIVTNNEARDFANLPGFFDAVIIDAPCSGEGMFRKDAGAIEEWSLQNVNMCAQRQRNILADVWDALKTDGILVYSTCTFNTEENEENVHWICEELGAEILKIDLGDNTNITESDAGYRFYPHKTRGEGFFLSVLRKKTQPERKLKYKTDKNKPQKPISKNSILPITLNKEEKWEIVPLNNLLYAYPKQRQNDYLLIVNQLRCIHSGILLGEIKGSDFIPSTCSALSKELNKEALKTVELNYETAISFLKKEAIQLPDTTRGFILVCYKGQALGWVKNVGNRCNNLYPTEWRIRMNI